MQKLLSEYGFLILAIIISFVAIELIMNIFFINDISISNLIEIWVLKLI